LLDVIGQDLCGTLLSLFPSDPTTGIKIEWHPWKFSTLRAEWWTRGNQVVYIQWLQRSLGLEKMEDWYQLSPNTLSAHFGINITLATFSSFSNTPLLGTPLLKLYGSVSGLVQSLVDKPDEPWKPWMFRENQRPTWWESNENKLSFFHWYLANIAHTDDPSVLLAIAPEELSALGGSLPLPIPPNYSN